MNGSIILCDHVYETKDGKFVIAGTYNHWRCAGSQLNIPQLHCYIRLYPERTGPLVCKIILRDENLLNNTPAIMNATVTMNISAAQIPVMEFAFHSNAPGEMRVSFPEELPEGKDIMVPLSLCLMVDDEIVATSPLKVSFKKVL